MVQGTVYEYWENTVSCNLPKYASIPLLYLQRDYISAVNNDYNLQALI